MPALSKRLSRTIRAHSSAAACGAPNKCADTSEDALIGKVAKQHVPSDLKLVEFFGYTLGGFYLARYDDSPAGAFDELVVLAGLVWNAPTSCAWAARVFVNNAEARDHGLHHVGLPSRLAHFTEDRQPYAEAVTTSGSPQRPPFELAAVAASISSGNVGWQPAVEVEGGGAVGAAAVNGRCSWWRQQLAAGAGNWPVQVHDLDHGSGTVRRQGLRLPMVTLRLPEAHPPGALKGPRIQLPLPSFSGLTAHVPHMLRYACDLHTNVRPVHAAKVQVQPADDDGSDGLSGVLGGWPVLALAFDDMEMTVQAPVRVES